MYRKPYTQIECLNNKGHLCKLLENSGSYLISYCTSKVEATNDVQVDTAAGGKEESIKSDTVIAQHN